MIKKLLIANRGEIACRIMKTCKRLGIRTVAVYSDADVHARHVQMADEAIHLGGAPAVESYLAIEKIIKAAMQSGADAIHPGFGFLAENSAFAKACADANLIFVGPSPHAIEIMGNKAAAKELMIDSNVPLIPGYGGQDQKDETLLAAAEEIGYPLMVKAAAGGGGKGMRIVENSDALPDALATARREGEQSFGSDELILERALLNARHIEIQVFGDNHGNIIHLGERDCSVQRRHQKVVEEAPAVGLSPNLRHEMGQAAVRAAQSVAYSGAGTVEFLLEKDEAFYFLEMNTRIQVEHPVTEMITGQDLVEWQIRVAEGESLPLTQEQVSLNGHAIEVRIYSENPANDFLPITGEVALWQPPDDEGIRVDSGLNHQDNISIYYDPMIAKLIAHGPDRKTARRRLLKALGDTRLIGLVNNIAFLQDVLEHPVFGSGQAGTRFIEEHLSDWQPNSIDANLTLISATIFQHHHEPQTAVSNGYWRNSPNRSQHYCYIDQPLVELVPTKEGYQVVIDGDLFTVTAEFQPNHAITLTINGHRQTVTVMAVNDTIWVSGSEGTAVLIVESLLPKPESNTGGAGSLKAPMPGVVLEMMVAVGDKVDADQPLLKLEAMKMEHTIRSSGSGVVTAVNYQVGDQVEADAQLLVIDLID